MKASSDLSHSTELPDYPMKLYKEVGVNKNIKPINTGMRGYLRQNQRPISEHSVDR